MRTGRTESLGIAPRQADLWKLSARVWLVAGCRGDERAGSQGTPSFKRRLKFQEGPDITLRKLKSLLAGEQDGAPLPSRQKLCESDITDYTATNSSKTKTVTEEQRQVARYRYRNRLA